MINNFEISTFIQEFSTHCTKTQIKEFKKNEIITTYLVNRKQLCILISGNADLVKYDVNGSRIVTERFTRQFHFR